MNREERVVGVIKNVPNRQGTLGVWLLTGTYERILDALERLDACDRERDGIRSAAEKLAIQLVELREDACALAQAIEAVMDPLEGYAEGLLWRTWQNRLVEVLRCPGVRRLMEEK